MRTATTRGPVAAGLLALLALLAGGAWLINIYVAKERQRDLDDWSVRLGLVAQNRVNVIEDWLDGRRGALTELVNNASLQLYLWQLGKREDGDPAVEPAQLSYLRNLLLAAAQRDGFMDETAQPEIPANLPRRFASGLALLDRHSRLVVSTAGMPEIGAAFENTIARALQEGTAMVSDPVLDAHERVLLGFAVPVPAVLGAKAAGEPAGVVFGVLSAADTLYPLLTSSVRMTSGDESLLVGAREGHAVYLSPTRDGATPTRKTLPLDRAGLAAAAAIASPGDFGEYLNYRRQAVLATSRTLRSVPWLLVEQVAAGEALAESDRHRDALITTFSLLLFFIAATLVAAWRHGSSVRATHDAEALRAKTRELEKQTELLHAVTDNTEALVVLMDADQRVLFANAGLASTLHIAADELAGSLAGLIGPANVQAMQDSLEAARKDATAQHFTRELSFAADARYFQCSLVPVDRVGERFNALLLVMQDISELQRTQRKHSALMRNLVDTLMHVVDLHDPNSANHSSRMAAVANAIGRELRLNETDSRTLDLAASLANLGKIFVPKEVLTKTAELSEAEQALLHRHVQFGTEMLQDLDFEGPVLDTIAQKQEHLDGSGYPAGLSGETILLTARILAVANAFVALLSPRAYRDAVSVEQALAQLLSEAGSKYDRHVIAALFHVAENRKDWWDPEQDA